MKYKVLIETTTTTVYEDNNQENLSDNRVVGTLLNNSMIKEFLNNIPITEYYIKTDELPLYESNITKLDKKKAYYILDRINDLLEAEKENNKSNKKRLR